MVSFDAYLNWLGIPPHEQPPNFYRLLGVVLFESNPEVIQQAADRQSLHVGSFQAGPQGDMCQQLMDEIAMARYCLLDPQQKAAYDGQLCGSLAQRGERAVAAPPPPAWMGGGQFSPQSPQFGSQAGMGPIHPGQAAQGPMIPGSPMPMQASMPGVAPMPGPSMMPPPSQPQPVMQMPPTMMSAPPGFAPAMPRPVAPAAMPVAAPFPLPTSRPVAAAPAAPRSAASAPAAPPPNPPAAPPGPIDELESLAAQPTTRHRPLKKKQSSDYTKQIIMGSVVAAAGVLLFIVWAAVRSNDDTPRGFDKAVEPVKHPTLPPPKLVKEHKPKEKRIEKESEPERAKPAVAERTVVNRGNNDALRPFGTDAQPKQGSQQGDDYENPHHFGPPTRTMDSPDSGGHAGPGPNAAGHDGPQDLGGDKDPVFETPKM